MFECDESAIITPDTKRVLIRYLVKQSEFCNEVAEDLIRRGEAVQAKTFIVRADELTLKITDLKENLD